MQKLQQAPDTTTTTSVADRPSDPFRTSGLSIVRKGYNTAEVDALLVAAAEMLDRTTQEATVVARALEAAQADASRSAERAEAAERRLSEAEARLEAALSEAADTATRLHGLEQELAAAQARLERAETAGPSPSALADAEREIAALRREIADASSVGDGLRGKISQLEEARVRANMQSAEFADAIDRLAEADAALRASEARRAEMEARVAELEAALADARQDEAERAELAQLRVQVQQLRGSLQRATREGAAIAEAGRKADERSAALTRELEELRGEMGRALAAREEGTTSLRAVQAELAATQAALDATHAAVESVQRDLESVTADRDRAESRVADLQEELRKATSELPDREVLVDGVGPLIGSLLRDAETTAAALRREAEAEAAQILALAQEDADRVRTAADEAATQARLAAEEEAREIRGTAERRARQVEFELRRTRKREERRITQIRTAGDSLAAHLAAARTGLEQVLSVVPDVDVDAPE